MCVCFTPAQETAEAQRTCDRCAQKGEFFGPTKFGAQEKSRENPRRYEAGDCSTRICTSKCSSWPEFRNHVKMITIIEFV